MKKKTQRVIVILLAAALLLTVLLPVLSMLAGAITQDDIDDIKDELSDITAQKNRVQQELNAIRGDMSKAQEQVELIQGQIVLTEQEISVSQRLLDQYDLEIQDKEEEIAALEEEKAQQYTEFCAHVRWVEETGSISYLSILFQAGSFSEFLDYAMLITDIMEYSNRIINALQATQQELDDARAELQTARDGQSEAHKTLENQRAELEARRLEAEELYAQIADQEKEIAAKARQLAADEAEMRNELKKAEEEYAAQIAALQNTGAWYWPLPGQYYISSVFGGRYSPINGKWESHTGTDIPASSGTEIHAAQGGIVTVAKWNVSYGYYCMISHGNGYVTLYAHMRKMPSVSVGQTVTKGQVIGYVGSTGDSTGPHLHFELRINGERSDVLKLYPDLPYTGPYVNIIKQRLGK